MITRASVARYIVDTAPAERSTAIQQVAAWLVRNGRKREARYVIQDVAKLMQDAGSIWATVTVARPLDARSRAAIEQHIQESTGCNEVSIDVVVNPDTVGGVRIDTPQGALDTTIKTKLSDFIARSMKNV